MNQNSFKTPFLFLKEHLRTVIILIIGGLISGGLQILFFIILNNSLSLMINNSTLDISIMMRSIVVLILYLLTSRMFLKYAISYSLHLTNNIRNNLINFIIEMPYAKMYMSKEKINTFFRKDTEVISRTILIYIQFFSSIVIIIGCLIYLLFLSINIFIYIILTSSISSIVFVFFSNRYRKHLKRGRDEEDIYFHHIGQIINGFKEIKINMDIGAEIIDGPLKKASNSYIFHSIKGYKGYFNCNFTIQFILYLSILVLLFTGQFYWGLDSSTVISSMIIILFIIGPLMSIINIIPTIEECRVSISRIYELINSIGNNRQVKNEQYNDNEFSTIEYNNISFRYKSLAPTFSIGPLNMIVSKGEVCFIYGGNGAGKTTLINIILGILEYDEGNIILDGVEISRIPTNLYVPVFSDFYLFDNLYGVENLSNEKINKYIKLFDLEGKVKIVEGRFSTINLSTGQKKRLALIHALLSNRKILVLDEWAADQDPIFRKFFYEEILGVLKKDGYTIIAVTHDDKYFKYADSLFSMNSGCLTKIK